MIYLRLIHTFETMTNLGNSLRLNFTRFRIISLVLLASFLFLVSCNSTTPPVSTPQETIFLPSPEVYTTQLPEAKDAARAFLENWKKEDYPKMYALLTSNAKQSIDEQKFIQRYKDVANQAALIDIDYELLTVDEPIEESAIAKYKVALHSAVVGDIEREITMDLKLENGLWTVDWNDSLIMPELAGGNYLNMDRDILPRGDIYDRNGNPLAVQSDAVAIGLWPDYINFDESKGLLSLLSTVTGIRSDKILGKIENALPGAYLPLAQVPADQDPGRIELLSEYGSIVTSSYSRRLYPDQGIAPHVVGYVSQIQQEELDEFKRMGYRDDERVGRKGVELWGESTLVGEHGGTLYAFKPDGTLTGQLGSAPSQPGQDIYLTIDQDLQREAQKAMSIYNGAIVVLERDTGRVLAMVSTPGFDPNAYETDNYNWNTLLNETLTDPDTPELNRAAEGQYPLGSVFKIITIAAALESGRYTSESTYDCQYVFEELPGFPRYDWTYEYFQEDGETQPSGLLTLPQGLIRSCNPYFWHIGLDLYTVGLKTAISEMARKFGLGSPTGIIGIPEESGNIPDPQSEVDSINLAVGQGDTQVTPLQVARFIAAIGNGGNLYRPQIIEKFISASNQESNIFKPEIQGSLPIKPENLRIIQEAMKGVVSNERPRGTAYRELNGLDIPVAGKTGTAETGLENPHAWFAGYTFAGREDKPDIAVAVIAESAGQGSEIAAPIFRRIVELYFYGKPLKLYRWEATFDVTRSPTPITTDTPTPQPNINP